METRECVRLASTSETPMAEVRVGDRSRHQGLFRPGYGDDGIMNRFARRVKSFSQNPQSIFDVP